MGSTLTGLYTRRSGLLPRWTTIVPTFVPIACTGLYLSYGFLLHSLSKFWLAFALPLIGVWLAMLASWMRIGWELWKDREA